MPVYAGMSQGSGFGPGIDGAAKALTYFAGGAILGGALAYGPISGLNYGPYASGALVSLASAAGGVAVLYAISMMTDRY